MPETAKNELSTAEFLAELRRRDVSCLVEGDRLRVSAPTEAVDAALRDELSRRKGEILAFLTNSRSEGPTRPPLRKRSLDGRAGLPLSFAQQRMWFLQQLDPESPAYNLQTSVPLPGPIDLAALRRSLTEVVRRHEILRTTFRLMGAEPVQVVEPPSRVALRTQDVGGASPEATEAAAWLARTQEVRRLFDLQRGPLFRTTLLRLGDDLYELLLTQHHIVTDGWSIAVLIEEILALYRDFRAGRGPSLSEPALQYADFAIAQREWLREDVVEAHLGYWRRQLAGLPALEMPTDRPRPPVQSTKGRVHWLELPKDLSAGLGALARGEGATLFMVLLAALDTLLRRYTGQSDVAVGTPSGSRSWVETERMPGLFLNTLVLRTDVSGNPSFLELLQRVKRVVLDASAHEELPFERLVEELQPTRDLSRAPLFQVLLILQNTPLEGLAARPREGQSLIAETGTSSFDLTLYLMDTADGLRGYIEYASALFDASTVARLASHFQTLLQAIVANPRQPILDLPLMSAGENEAVPGHAGATAVEYPASCVQDRIADVAARIGPRTAVVSGERSLTYGELDRRANQLAHRLARHGVGSGSLVGICLERSIEMVVGLLGILKAGAAYVPLDPAFPTARLAHVLADARLPLVLTEGALVDALPRTGVQRLFLDRHETLEGEPDDARGLPRVGLGDRAYVLYTSGSTGRPKGVEIEHRGLANFLCSMQNEPGIAESDVLVAVTTLSFDIAGLELYLPLLAGARLVVASREVAQDGPRLASLLSSSGATLLQATPATWRMLEESGWRGSPELTMLCGGEALPRELARTLRPRGRALFNLYGPTETTIWSTVHRVSSGDGPVPLGRAIANTRLHVLDERLRHVPPGVPGELWIGGHGVARGYLGRPDLTAERFLPDPFGGETGQRIYRTGDLVRRRVDGRLEYLGRTDEQAKVRGFRVELGEVEAALAQHPFVQSGAVVARDDSSGQKRLFAYFVVRPGHDPSATELRTFLGERLPAYMVPTGFARLDVLPLTPNGKVDRRALPEIAPSRPELGALVPPRTATEAELVHLWRDILRAGEVGVHDNFFELGGHSILATQMVSRLRDTLGVELPLRRLFETPTVAGVADWIADAQGGSREAEAAIPRLATEHGRPLSFGQERLWFLERMDPGSPTYNLSGAVRLRGALDRPALERSLQEVVRRHEALRATFADEAQGVVQRIGPSPIVPFDQSDLSGIAPEEREANARRLAEQESRRPFDLRSGPLFRARLLRLGEEDHVLVLVMHHIVSDAWSMGVLVREIGTLYRAFAAGEPSPLPELPVQYGDFAAWQRQALETEGLRGQLEYWKKQLGAGLPTLELPLDRPRPQQRMGAGGHEVFELPRPPGGCDGLHDAAGRLSGPAPPDLRPGRRGRGFTHLRAQPKRGGGPDRAVRQHAGPAHRLLRRSDVSRAAASGA
jgi:amino acid adenylation domain-containing protein